MTISKFRDFVRKEFPDSVVVPLKEDEKRPIFNHKGMTSEQIYETHKPPSATHKTWGILLGKDLLCIDFDDEDKHTEYIQKFPGDFGTAPWETTNHGHHYYFLNDQDYICENAIESKIDFLAIDKTGTRHNCVCDPSLGKVWQRSLMTTLISPMTPVLKQHFADLLQQKKKAVPESTIANDNVDRTKLPLALVKKILKGIDATKCETRAQWFEVCCLVKNSSSELEAAKYRDVLQKFCKRMSNYNEEEVNATWYQENETAQRVGLPTWVKLITRCGDTTHLHLLPKKPRPEGTVFDSQHDCMLEICNRLKDRIYISDGVVWFRKESDGLWLSGRKEAEMAIRFFVGQQELCQFVQGKEVVVSKNFTFKGQCAKQSMDNIEERPAFSQHLQRATIGMLPFRDGVYNFHTKKFTSGFGHVDCCKTCPRDFPAERNTNIEKELLKRFFLECFDDNTDLVGWKLHSLAKALAGEGDKKWYHFTGARDSGKSLLFRCLKSAFGSHFVKAANGGSFLCGKSRGSDEAKNNSWLIGHQWARLTYCSEMPKKGIINGASMKSFAGADAREVRANYENEREINIVSTLYILSNHMPEADDSDVFKTMLEVTYPCEFKDLDGVDKDYRSHNVIKQADPLIKDWLDLPEVCDAMFWLLVDAYHKPYPTPQEVIDTRADYICSGNPILEAFDEHLEYTGKASDKITTKQLLSILGQEREVPDVPSSFRGQFKKNMLAFLQDPTNSKEPKTHSQSLLRYINIKPEKFVEFGNDDNFDED